MGKDVRKDLTTRDLGRALGRKIARLERHVRELEVASQGAFRSVEEGAIDWYDENGVLRERVGKQKDGSYGRKTFTGDIPPAPSEPDVVVISDGVVAITWDGRWEERYSHVGWRNVQIHLGDTATFTPDRDTQVGAIFAPRGGTVVAVTESDDDNPVWVRLVGMNDAGQTGDPSTAVLVDELDEDDVEEEDEELQWEDGDGHTLTTADVAAGTVTFGLSHYPEEEAVLAFVGGVHQKATSYSVDYEAPSVTWSLAGWEPVGARMSVQYPYLSDEPDAIVPFASSGWRYLQVAKTDTTDRSGTGFDDSGWSVASAPFGSVSNPPGWPPWVSSWAGNTALWTRREVAVSPRGTVVVTVRGEVAKIYWNGVQVGSFGDPNIDSPGVEYEVVIPAGDVLASNTLAILHIDDNAGPGSGTYADAEVRYQ